MIVLGISAFYHDSACCLLRDGRLTVAAQEERFSRRKYDAGAPVAAFRACLDAGGLSITDVDAIAYYEAPRIKLARQLWAGPGATDVDDPAWLDTDRAQRELRRSLGWDGPLFTFPHHRSHAASAFFYSGFDAAAVLTADGVGEWTTTAYGHASGGELEIFEEVCFPHSLGLLYSTVTSYLGFRVNDGEPKVMGLAAYGETRYVDEVCQLIGMGVDGQFLLNLRYFDFLRGRRMFSPHLCELFGQSPRHPDEELTDFHRDLARSLQLVIEEILLEKAAYLHRRTGASALCLAGGVALNCVANGRLRREGPFERLFIQPAAGDAGGALGAAALAHIELTGEPPIREPLRSVDLGPSYTAGEVSALVDATGLAALDYRRCEPELLEEVAARLADRKVVGWFHGRMEFGPRALGCRSLLANPLDPEMRDRLNRSVKKRESFRPFAPAVLVEEAGRHFELDHPSPFMLEACAVTSELELPAITHVDGSARPQTVDRRAQPRFAALLDAFHRHTGCPILVNTSFNVAGEPIVCSPIDALWTMACSEIDCLVLEDFLIDREMLPRHWHRLLPHWDRRAPRADRGEAKDLYTFV